MCDPIAAVHAHRIKSRKTVILVLVSRSVLFGRNGRFECGKLRFPGQVLSRRVQRSTVQHYSNLCDLKRPQTICFGALDSSGVSVARRKSLNWPSH